MMQAAQTDLEPSPAKKPDMPDVEQGTMRELSSEAPCKDMENKKSRLSREMVGNGEK